MAESQPHPSPLSFLSGSHFFSLPCQSLHTPHAHPCQPPAIVHVELRSLRPATGPSLNTLRSSLLCKPLGSVLSQYPLCVLPFTRNGFLFFWGGGVILQGTADTGALLSGLPWWRESSLLGVHVCFSRSLLHHAGMEAFARPPPSI